MRLAAKPHFFLTGFATAAQSTQRELHFRIGILLAAENDASLGIASARVMWRRHCWRDRRSIHPWTQIWLIVAAPCTPKTGQRYS